MSARSGAERSPAVANGTGSLSEIAVLRAVAPVVGWRVALRLLLAALLAAAADLSGIALIGTATWLITRAAEQPPIMTLTVAIVGVRTFAIAKGGLRYAERLAGHDAALRILAALRTRVYAGLSARSSATVDPEHRGDLLSRLVSDVDGVQDLLLRCAVPAAVAVLVATSATGFVAASLPAAGALLAAGLLIQAVLLPGAAYLVSRRSARRAAGARGAVVASGVDLVHGSADLAAYGATAEALGRADRAARSLARLERAASNAATALGAVGSVVPVATAIGVALIVLAARGGGLMSAVLALIALASVEAVAPLTSAAVRYADLRGCLRRVAAILDRAPAEPSPAPLEQRPVAGTVSVRLRQVEVRYRPDRPPALAGVDLDLPPGRVVAVVGPSGCGKSTLLGVLAGEVPVTSGEVDVSVDAERWRVVGGVYADAHVFHTTVRENLTLGRPVGDTAIANALRTAGLPDWADRLDNVVGEDGRQVSGGQRQRLLLARALLALPPVLVLDEPTEALDPAAADAVLGDVISAVARPGAVGAPLAGRSVVLVTHRLVGLARCDEILVLDAGRVVQRGRHADLVARPGWYAEQWRAQQVAELAYPALL